jgi:hypothetical protein
LGLENPNSGLDPGETFFPNSVSDLGSAETFPKCRSRYRRERLSSRFTALQEGIRLPHAILFDFRGFSVFCMRYLIPFCKLQKGNCFFLELEQKGACNPFK